MESGSYDETEENDTDISQTNEDGVIEKQIRREYRQYREEMIENRMECIDPNSNLIENILEKVERTFKSVKKPREAVSDSNALYELAILGTERIKNLKCAFRSFNNIEFMEKLKVYIADHSPVNKKEPVTNEEELSSEEEMIPSTRRSQSQKNTSKKYILTQPIIARFGTNVMSYFRILPRPKLLLGSLEKELVLVKKQIVRQRRDKRNDELVRTKIKELDVNSKDHEDNNTVSETERIYNILMKRFRKTKGEPFCFYEVLINPHSFSRTIENIFYVSFLIKDGFAKIFLDEDELPVIAPIENPTVKQSQSADDKKINIQSMISLNKKQWKELIDVFEIDHAFISDPKR